MVPSGLLLATLLVAQASSGPSAAPSAGPRTAPLVSVQEHLAEDAPEKLIAEAVEPTDHEALAGEPEPLVSVLARMGSDRGRQLRAIGAYWQLVSAVADYHYRQHEVDYLRQLEGFESSATDKAGDRQGAGGDPLRIAAADARRGQAQLNAIVAQHALAALLGAPATTPLPLPVDRPHVNAYRTYYQQLFPNGGSLALRRIDATLPLRRQEIAIRARCVRRAETALQSAETAYVSKRGPRRELLDCLRQLSRERNVCRVGAKIQRRYRRIRRVRGSPRHIAQRLGRDDVGQSRDTATIFADAGVHSLDNGSRNGPSATYHSPGQLQSARHIQHPPGAAKGAIPRWRPGSSLW